MDNSSELIEILDLGSARGGRKLAAPVLVEVVRSLREEDLPVLAEPVNSPGQAVSKLRSSHHLLARQLAMGADLTEASLASGYSIAYISTLQHNDPAFKSLVESYRDEREALFIDAIKRLRSLGIDATEELQARLAEEPEGFTKAELMNLVKMSLVDTMPRGAGGPSGDISGGTTVNIKFVTPQQQAGPTIVLDPIDLEPSE